MLRRISHLLPSIRASKNATGEIKANNVAFARALRSCPGFRYPQGSNTPHLILPRESYNIDALKEKIFENGVQPNENTLEMKASATMPLQREDSALKEIDIRREKINNTITICGYIYAAGLSILRLTPFQHMQSEGIRSYAQFRLDKMEKEIIESRENVQKELDARIARRKDLEEYSRTMQSHLSRDSE